MPATAFSKYSNVAAVQSIYIDLSICHSNHSFPSLNIFS